MESPLKGNFEHGQTGWTGMKASGDAPKTVERKRKGRGVDVIGSSLPTPPPHHPDQLPTPETVRRSGRTSKKTDTQPHASTSTHLPTPQTQRTRRRAPPPSSDAQAQPSPSGHTTFFLSSTASASASRPEKIRRRPGLTFAQQMGLLSSTADKTASRGVGVGIGGHKTGGHGRVDQIGAMPKIEENPFFVPTGLSAPGGLASPGVITSHRPTEPESDSEAEGAPMLASPRPRRSPRLGSPSPSTQLFKPILLPSSISTGLLSPPPTRHAPRIGVIDTNGKVKSLTRVEKEARERRKHEAELRKRMLDIDDNPFLVKPGEPSTRRPGPIVDEDLPTVTYVFRGAKKVFANPLYPSRAPFPQADMHPEDDDFEPHPLPKPKLLWPTGPSPSKRINLEAARTPSPDPEASPPSSPVSTPTISRRFGKVELTRGNSIRIDNDPTSVFSDDEGEVIVRNSRGHGHEEHELEDGLPSRRGMLFAAGAEGTKGLKRSFEPIVGSGLGHGHGHGHGSGSGDEGRSKKARGLFRL